MTEISEQMIEAAVQKVRDEINAAYASGRISNDAVMAERFARAALTAALAVRESPNIRCNHEPYLGRCAHCDVPFKGGRPVLSASGEISHE